MKMAKFVCLVTILVLGAYVDAFNKNFLDNPTIEECISSSGVNVEELRKKPDFNEMSPETLCFMKCSAEKLGWLSEDGDVIFDTENSTPCPMGFSEEQRMEFRECVVNVGQIKECQDMAKVLECMPKPPNHPKP